MLCSPTLPLHFLSYQNSLAASYWKRPAEIAQLVVAVSGMMQDRPPCLPGSVLRLLRSAIPCPLLTRGYLFLHDEQIRMGVCYATLPRALTQVSHAASHFR